MKRGRKPTPTALRIVNGNPGGRPFNDLEPETDGPLGPPPTGWTQEAAAIWREIVDLAPANVLTRSDRILVELAARNVANMRAKPDLPAALSAEIRRCLAEMGMSPAERTRLTAPKPAANPFADLDGDA